MKTKRKKKKKKCLLLLKDVYPQNKHDKEDKSELKWCQGIENNWRWLKERLPSSHMELDIFNFPGPRLKVDARFAMNFSLFLDLRHRLVEDVFGGLGWQRMITKTTCWTKCTWKIYRFWFYRKHVWRSQS